MAHSLYEIDVRLRDIAPPIWRTIELAGSSTLEELHFAIQCAMGWTNSHLHQFTIGKKQYGMVDVDEAQNLEDERSVRLQDVVKQGDRLLYEYDFGDDWEHDVTIKKVTTAAKAPRLRCTDGKRACPPEDCGGPGGYERLIEALADPANAEHREVIEWAGDFEAERFELPKSGRDLRREIDELKALAEEDAGDEIEDGDGIALPEQLVEAVLALDPMQRASLAALIAGSLAQELIEVHTAAAQLVDDLKRQQKSTQSHRRRART